MNEGIVFLKNRRGGYGFLFDLTPAPLQRRRDEGLRSKFFPDFKYSFVFLRTKISD